MVKTQMSGWMNGDADLDIIWVAFQQAIVDGSGAGPAGQTTLLSSVQTQ